MKNMNAINKMLLATLIVLPVVSTQSFAGVVGTAKIKAEAVGQAFKGAAASGYNWAKNNANGVRNLTARCASSMRDGVVAGWNKVPSFNDVKAVVAFNNIKGSVKAFPRALLTYAKSNPGRTAAITAAVVAPIAALAWWKWHRNPVEFPKN